MLGGGPTETVTAANIESFLGCVFNLILFQPKFRIGINPDLL